MFWSHLRVLSTSMSKVGVADIESDLERNRIPILNGWKHISPESELRVILLELTGQPARRSAGLALGYAAFCFECFRDRDYRGHMKSFGLVV